MNRSYLVETTSESALSLSTEVPLLVQYSKRDVFVRWTTYELDEASVLLSSDRRGLATFPTIFTLDAVRRGPHLVYQVGIEDVKFVSLDDLRGRVVVIVMSLIVFVPFIAHLDTIEVSGFAGSVLVGPLRFRLRRDFFFAGENLLVVLHPPCHLPLVERRGGRRKVFTGNWGEARKLCRIAVRIFGCDRVLAPLGLTLFQRNVAQFLDSASF